MRLEILRKLLERDFRAGMQDLMELQTLAQSQIRDLRVFLHSMRPVDVDGAPWWPWPGAAPNPSRRKRHSGDVSGTNTPGLSQEMTAEVLQMLREALHNVQKHASATRVAVSMEKTDRGLEISVTTTATVSTSPEPTRWKSWRCCGWARQSQAARALLNADLQLESRPGRGRCEVSDTLQ